MSVELGEACRVGDVDRVLELVTAGHSPDEPLDSVGSTPLMVATNVATIEVLLAAGAATHPTRHGHDALQIVISDEESAIASSGERLAAARRLIAHGAPLNRRNQHGWSRLYAAAFAGDLGAVEGLIALGADPNDEPPPLEAACWGSGVATTGAIVDALVAAGADVHRRDGAGWSLLHAAAMPYSHGTGFASSDGASPDAIVALVRHGVPPDVVGPDDTTALMLTAADGAVDAVEALLAAGADPSRTDRLGRRALDHAREAERQLEAVLADAAAESRAAITDARDRARRCGDRLAHG